MSTPSDPIVTPNFVPPDPEESAQAGCGCLAFLLQTGTIIWLVSGHVGIAKGILTAVVGTLASWLLSLFGIIPVLGQALYRNHAGGVIDWVIESVGVDPSIRVEAPRLINRILRWVLIDDQVTGTLSSYVFAAGYSLSFAVSLFTVFGLFVHFMRRRWE